MSLIHWWPLNGDTKDYGVLNNNLSSNYLTYDNAGKIGKCGHINNNNIPLNIAAADLPYNTKGISFCGWFKFNKAEIQNILNTRTFTSSQPYATGNLIGNNDYGGFGLIWTTNDIYPSGTFSYLRVGAIQRDSNGTAYATWRTISDFDTWYHFVASIDPVKGKVSFYVNGSLYVETTKNSPQLSSRNYYINVGFVFGGNGPGLSIPFYSNDIRIYNHALSAKEVKEISKGLVLHYDFEDPYVEGSRNLGHTSTTYSNKTYKVNYTCNSWGGDAGTCTFYKNGGYCDYPYKVYHKTATGSGGIYYKTADDITIESGKTYTMSVYIRANRSFTASEYSFNINRGSDNNYITYGKSFTITPAWQRLEKTFTATSSQAGTYGEMSIIYDDGVTDYYVYYSGFQIEPKDHATPFVPAIRAVGNSIGDCSGYGYQGTLIGSPEVIESNDGSGKYCLDLCASEKYVKTTKLNFITAGTVVVWAKYPSSDSSNSKMILAEDTSTTYFLAAANSDNSWYNNSAGSITAHRDGTANNKLIRDDKWHCYVFTGVNLSSWPGNVTICYYGGYSNGYQFHGYIGDIKIYSTILSNDDIVAEYNRKASIDKNGILFTGEFEEGDNISNINIAKTNMIKCNNIIEGTNNVKLIGDYTQLEYLGSTGTQIINTGYTLTSNNFIFEDVYEYASLTSGEACIGGTSSSFEFGCTNGNFFNYITGLGSAYGPGTPNVDTKYQYKAIVSDSTYICEINGVKGNSKTHSKNVVGETVWINRYYSASHQLNGKQYSIRIWDNGILVRDFIPAKRNRDNVLGFYDLINKQFYTNAGSGTFTAGPEIGKINAIYANEIKEI